MLGQFDYTGAATLVAAIGGIVASVLAYLARKPAAAAAVNSAIAADALAMPCNGGTIGEHVDNIAKAVGGDPSTVHDARPTP